jgi:hypothetical protein
VIHAVQLLVLVALVKTPLGLKPYLSPPVRGTQVAGRIVFLQDPKVKKEEDNDFISPGPRIGYRCGDFVFRRMRRIAAIRSHSSPRVFCSTRDGAAFRIVDVAGGKE